MRSIKVTEITMRYYFDITFKEVPSTKVTGMRTVNSVESDNMEHNGLEFRQASIRESKA